ncbi:MAG: hypothetical protein IKY78_03575 [Clostridia bacterium]|nr:hypothetical protein [Clostridia bacterium]
MKKKAVAICLLVIMIMSLFSGCSEETIFLTVDGKTISKGLYTYYLDRVLTSPEEYGIEALDSKAAREAALECCKRYVASEKYLKEIGITLSSNNKQSVATEVETSWSLYQGYYNKLGVSKPDLTEALTHEYRLKQLVDYYYGPEGVEPVDEMELKETFVDLYVGFRAIAVPLTKENSLGETVPLTEAEQEALLNLLRGYRSEINEGMKTIDEVNVEYNDTLDIIVTENLEINVVKIGSPMYTQEFYDTMLEISHTRAGIIICPNTMYLVQREKIATTSEDEFYVYRAGLLEELKIDEIREQINTSAVDLVAEIDSTAADEIYRSIYKEPAVPEVETTEEDTTVATAEETN